MPRTSISFGGRRIGPGQPVLVIAEIGVNHNGDVALAENLVDAAAEAGADAVKFQAFSAERVASADAPKVAYQLETTGAGESQREMLRRLELGREDFTRIVRRCEGRRVLFLASAFDEESVDLLADLDVPAFKVASGELTNWPLLESIAAKKRPVILSTGMANVDEIRGALDVLRESTVALLHCVSNYPADPADANLNAIGTLRETFGVPVGYSDHTTGAETALAAVALGACIVEKHFTLDAAQPGPDHRASLEPDAFRALVHGIRVVESALGDGVKRPAASELDTRTVARRSIVAARDLAAGEILEPGMLGALRPGTGIPPTQRAEVIGRRLNRPLRAGEPLAWDDLE